MNLDNLTVDEVRAIQIANIRARLAARTQGSWIATLDSDGWCVSSVPDEGAPQQRMETLARLGSGSPASDTSDACFIASAPDDIITLLAEVDRLTSERDAARLPAIALPIDPEADAMFDALQPSLGAPVPPERRIRRQADVDAAFARGAESMRAAAVEIASKRANLQRFTDSDCAWGRSAECIRDELRHLPVPEDKS